VIQLGDIKLTLPTYKYRKSFLQNCDLKSIGFSSFNQYLKEAQLVRSSVKQTQEHGTPRTEFWLVDKNQVIGFGTVRHLKSGSDSRIDSSIYYEIFKPFRSKGYGEILFRLLLNKARGLGISNIIVSVQESNFNSRKIIERFDFSSRQEVTLPDQKKFILYQFT
jgi:predicted acetyltransferase